MIQDQGASRADYFGITIVHSGAFLKLFPFRRLYFGRSPIDLLHRLSTLLFISKMPSRTSPPFHKLLALLGHICVASGGFAHNLKIVYL